MSGILAVVPRVGPAPSEPLIRRMLQRLRKRGEVGTVLRSDGAVLAACRWAWEPANSATVAGSAWQRSPKLVVADASLFYREDLALRLRAAGTGVPRDAPAADWIGESHRAWGGAAPGQLEGDFAYAVWDPTERALVCARDFAGRRPLFFAELPDAVVVASSLGAILEYPSCPRDLDPGSIAAAAAGLFASHTETAYRAVALLPPGHTLVVSGGAVRVLRHWDPPRVEDRPTVRGMTLHEGSERLRALLMEAVRVRLDPAGATSVWMSGGWDSTAVFGAGMGVLPPEVRLQHGLRPVSISYPPGDPGREDEYIEAVSKHWKAPVHWLHSSAIPFFERPEQRAAERDEPFGHTYETWNRALARGSRAVGSRIALDGVGGDQLFQLSFVNLSDLLRRGRWVALAREWKAKGLRGRRNAWQWALLPLLSESLRRVAARVVGAEEVRPYLERPVPAWMDRRFLERHGVLERERRNTPARAGLSAVAYETHWYLRHPYGGRILSTVTSLALEEGVEVRSPLLDRRVVEFACARPWSERSCGAETKRLLRGSVSGLLPAEVLAPRAFRTGVTSGFLARGFRGTHADLVTAAFEAPLLAQLGMVDANALRRAWDQYRRQGDENLAVSLYFTLQTELWVRGRAAASASGFS